MSYFQSLRVNAFRSVIKLDEFCKDFKKKFVKNFVKASAKILDFLQNAFLFKLSSKQR